MKLEIFPRKVFLKDILRFLLIGVLFVSPLWAGESPSLRLVQTIPLPGVKGRIDHLAVDVKDQRLFVAALGNDTIEILDLKSGQKVQSLEGFHEPQGVLFLSEKNQLIVTSGGDGQVAIFAADTLKPVGRLALSDDADNIRTREGVIYVGYGNGGIALIDPINGQQVGDIKLSGHPEAFEIEPQGERLFINIPEAKTIAIADRKSQQVTAAWPIESAQANFPMALDEAGHRLFVGTRFPPKLMIRDSATGKAVADLDIAGDPDDIFYDAERKRLYIACGAGFLEVIEQNGPDHYRKREELSTAAGARTGLFVPELKRLFLAVPQRGSRSAEIRVYEVSS